MNFEEFRSCIKSEYKFANVQVAETGTIGECKISVKNCSAQEKVIIKEALAPVFDIMGVTWADGGEKARFTNEHLEKASTNELRLALDASIQEHEPVLAHEFKPEDIISNDSICTLERVLEMSDEQLLKAAYQAALPVKGLPVVPVVGITGAGKSTFVNYMKGNSFVKDLNSRRNEIVLAQGQGEYSKIGDMKESTTFNPVIIKDKDADDNDIAYIDFAGFDDSRLRDKSLNAKQKEKITKYFMYLFKFTVELSKEVKPINILIASKHLTDEKDDEEPMTRLVNNLMFFMGCFSASDVNLSKKITTIITKTSHKEFNKIGVTEDISLQLAAWYAKYQDKPAEFMKTCSLILNSNITIFDPIGRLGKSRAATNDSRDEIKQQITNGHSISKAVFRVMPTDEFNKGYSFENDLKQAICKIIARGQDLLDKRKFINELMDKSSKKEAVSFLKRQISALQKRLGVIKDTSNSEELEQTLNFSRGEFDSTGSSIKPKLLDGIVHSRYRIVDEKSHIRPSFNWKLTKTILGQLADFGLSAGSVAGIGSLGALPAAISLATPVGQAAAVVAGISLGLASVRGLGKLIKNMEEWDNDRKPLEYEQLEVSHDYDNNGFKVTKVYLLPEQGFEASLTLALIIAPLNRAIVKFVAEMLQQQIARLEETVIEIENGDTDYEDYIDEQSELLQTTNKDIEQHRAIDYLFVQAIKNQNIISGLRELDELRKYEEGYIMHASPMTTSRPVRFSPQAKPMQSPYDAASETSDTHRLVDFLSSTM